MQHLAKRCGIYRSRLEQCVAQSLADMGHSASYESARISYISHHNYVPDFTIGDAHIEVKGYWPSSDRRKLLDTIRSNPTIKLLMAFEQPHLTLTRKSKTTYSMWCAKRGIAWCGIPIPPEFLKQWLHDPQRTFPVHQPIAKARTQQLSILTDQSSVFHAGEGSTVRATPGKGCLQG